MKTLLLCLFSVLFLFGCATTGDLKATQERLSRVEISEECHGKTVELMLLGSLLHNPNVQQNEELFTDLQLKFMVLQAEQKNACTKYEAQQKSQAK